MNQSVWRPGDAIVGPVYVDANILVGANISQHALYSSCANLLGQLLASEEPILLSPVVYSEAEWAIIKESYYHLQHLRPGAHFTKKIYRRWSSDIFQRYGPWLQAIEMWFASLERIGYPIDIVPRSSNQWSHAMSLTYTYMQQFVLTPSDAVHLALAEMHANVFITADSDFTRMSALPPGNLTILTIA